MSRPVDEMYFTWLYSFVGSVRTKNLAKSYWSLLRQLYTTEFIWFVPNDDNRAEDGRALRNEFIDQRSVSAGQDWMRLGCSMLELLLGLSRRLSFETDESVKTWFWRLLDNIGLSESSDAHPLDEEHIASVLKTVIWRTYEPDGRGGLFPLNHPRDDQRKVELWYQLCAYVLENVY